MIAEKLERSLNDLETLARRGNGDLEVLLPKLLDSMWCEVERVRAFESAAVLADAKTAESPHA